MLLLLGRLKIDCSFLDLSENWCNFSGFFEIFWSNLKLTFVKVVKGLLQDSLFFMTFL